MFLCAIFFLAFLNVIVNGMYPMNKLMKELRALGYKLDKLYWKLNVFLRMLDTYQTSVLLSMLHSSHLSF